MREAQSMEVPLKPTETLATRIDTIIQDELQMPVLQYVMGIHSVSQDSDEAIAKVHQIAAKQLMQVRVAIPTDSCTDVEDT